MSGRCTYLNEEKAYRSKKRRERETRQREIRKKIFLTFFTAGLVLFLSIFCHSFLAQAASASETVQYKYYKNVPVAYGDTLWSIAAENYVNGYETIDDYIFEVKEINHLEEDTVMAGQDLILPYYSSEFK